MVRDDEEPLTRRIIELAGVYGRYGTPRITALLRDEGWHVNHKRVERIWRREGMNVPKKQPKRGRLWLNDGSCVRLRAERRDHVWAYDFVQGRTKDSRAFRMLTIVDEYTRECLSIDVARRLRSEDVLERLSWLMATRGAPKHIRSDNGPELTADVVRSWLAAVGVKALFIEPWRRHYNTVRPHSALGYRPPAPEAIAAEPPSAALQAVLREPSPNCKLSYTVV